MHSHTERHLPSPSVLSEPGKRCPSRNRSSLGARSTDANEKTRKNKIKIKKSVNFECDLSKVPLNILLSIENADAECHFTRRLSRNAIYHIPFWQIVYFLTNDYTRPLQPNIGLFFVFRRINRDPRHTCHHDTRNEKINTFSFLISMFSHVFLFMRINQNLVFSFNSPKNIRECSKFSIFHSVANEMWCPAAHRLDTWVMWACRLRERKGRTCINCECLRHREISTSIFNV